MNKVIWLCLSLTVITGCGSPAPDPSRYSVEKGSYNSPLGSFNITLHLGDVEPTQQSVDDIGRIAYITLLSVEAAGRTHDMVEMTECINNISVYALSKDEYAEFCDPEESVGCFSSHYKNIYLLDQVSYNCENRYTIGHEIMHQIFECRGQWDHQYHATPNMFAWNPIDDEPGWVVDSAEDRIKDHPGSGCL